MYGYTNIGPSERYIPGSPEHKVFNQKVATDVFGCGCAPHAEQLLASVHDAYVTADDHAEGEQPK